MGLQKPIVPQQLHVGRGRLMILSAPELNLTPRELGDDGQFRLSFGGDLVNVLSTPTINVMARLLKVDIEISVPVIRTQEVARLWKERAQANSYLGDITLKLDSVQEGKWTFTNCALRRMPSISGGGNQAGSEYTIAGTWYCNDAEWNFEE